MTLVCLFARFTPHNWKCDGIIIIIIIISIIIIIIIIISDEHNILYQHQTAQYPASILAIRMRQEPQ